MINIGLDLGGTKISGAVFSENNSILIRETKYLEGRQGVQVAQLITEVSDFLIEKAGITNSTTFNIGICVPGIAYSKNGMVWAPNIKGWDRFPLKEYLLQKYPQAQIMVESDRTCYILGEVSQGVAKGCENAIFIAVGTGIGAGILIDGRVLHGASDIVGATGWMALQPPYQSKWDQCGCFESEASGNGIMSRAKELVKQMGNNYQGILSKGTLNSITTKGIFEAYDHNDPIATEVIDKAIQFWGMASANFISLFNPEMIVFGGGVFGPASNFIDRIHAEATKWAQPIAMKECRFAATTLPDTAGLYGAGAIARIGHYNSTNNTK